MEVLLFIFTGLVYAAEVYTAKVYAAEVCLPGKRRTTLLLDHLRRETHPCHCEALKEGSAVWPLSPKKREREDPLR